MKKIFGKEKTSSAIFIYTILFFICSIFIALIFYRHSRSFIWGDGIHQHFLNLNFYRNFLINKVTLGDFNTFTWNIGMGMDLFSSLAYYIVGDFVSYFSIFFEQNKLELFFDIECFVRVFLIGISFIFYSKYKGRSNFASIVSAFIYSFCNFALFASFRHPYFSNALFLLPLLMMGIEKIINEDKKTFYIISIFLTFLSSFYFAYMLSICLLIYGSILIISKYRKDGLKKIIKVYFKVFVCTLVGIGLSSAILIPTLKQFFGSSRTLSNSNYMYTYKYYIHLLNSLVYYGGTNWVVIGINGIALVSLPLAFKYHKENKNMLLLLIILFIPLLLVDVGSIFCGFSFPNNRWSFVISFIISCLTGNILDKHLNFDKSDIKLVITFNFVYFVILFLLVYKLSRISIFAFIIATGVLLIIINKNMFKKLFRKIKIIDGFKFSLTMFILLTTLMNTYMFYVGEGYADKDFAKRNTIFDIYETNYYTIDNFDEAISKIKSSDKDFYRIGKNPFELSNVSLYYDYNSINYYLSIVPNPLGQLGYDLSSWTYYTSHEVGELNSRSKLLSLLGVKYFITDEPSYAPTTYQNLFNIDNTNVYKNSYNVNFGTFYDKYIDISKYEMMSSLEKEDSLLKVVALNEKDIDDKYVTKEQKIDELINKDISKIDFEISNSNNKLTIKNSKDNYLTLKIKNYPNKSGGGDDLYLKINNLQYNAFSKDELFDIKVKNGKTRKYDFDKNYKYYQPINEFNINVEYGDLSFGKGFTDARTSPYSGGNNDLLLNLNDYQDDNTEIKIIFDNTGHYSYDSIELFELNYDSMEDDVNNLNRSNFKIEDYQQGYMKALVNFETNGILQFSTTYSDGWDIYIDGKKANSLKANKYFLGCYVSKGNHVVELKYHTPYLKLGIIISLISLISLCVIIIFEKKSGNKYEKKDGIKK